MLYIKINIITAFILGSVLLSGCAAKDKVLTFGMDQPDTVAVVDTIDDPAEIEDDPNEPVLLCVYVCGAVNNPGVVYLPEGSRVKDALDMVGGFSEDADVIRINLAKAVSDGEQLYFPREGEDELPVTASAQETESESTGRVNINTADKALLCTVPGIGEVKAEAIIKYRTENGLFSDISGIVQVPGIGEGVYNKIKEYICTDS